MDEVFSENSTTAPVETTAESDPKMAPGDPSMNPAGSDPKMLWDMLIDEKIEVFVDKLFDRLSFLLSRR